MKVIIDDYIKWKTAELLRNLRKINFINYLREVLIAVMEDTDKKELEYDSDLQYCCQGLCGSVCMSHVCYRWK